MGQQECSPSNDRDGKARVMNEAETPESLRALEGLLRWYAAMGVDALVDEVAHDRFVTPQPAAPPRAAPTSVAAQHALAPSAPASADVLAREAQASAAAAQTLDDLAARLAALPGRGLPANLGRMVLAGGAPGARIMLIAGAPEEDDVRAGTVFAGERGVLLDAMLRAIGLDRSAVYLANLIPWRPPGARAPTPLELALCLPFARRHIALSAPALLVCLGERAVQPLLDRSEPLTKLRGRWLTYEGEASTLPTLATFSPDYLLLQPQQKRRAWADLQMLAAALAG